MNLQPTLTGLLLEVSPLHSEDFADLFEAASDPLIWEMHPQPDRYKPDVFKSFFTEALLSKGAVKITDRGSGKVIGSSRFYDYSAENSSVIIGYTFLARKFWGGSFNYDLKKLMVNHALSNVKRAYFQVGLKNLRSQRALEKIGAVNTGIEEIAISYGPPKASYIYKIETLL